MVLKNIILFSILSFSFQVSSSENCKELKLKAKEQLAEIRSNMKKKADIHTALNSLEELIEKNPNCLTYMKLNISDNQMASFRKYKYAPDKKYNLEEESCSEITIDTSNMPKNNNQGPLSWCFAFTAADLLSFHEKKPFSAYDIAINSHLYEKENFPHAKKDFDNVSIGNVGGTVSLSIALALLMNEKGICLEKNFKTPDIDWLLLSKMIENLASSNQKISQIICDNKFNEKSLLQDIPNDILKILDKLPSDKRISALLDVKCTKREKVKSSYDIVSSDKSATNTDIMTKMDEVLKTGAPVSVSYDSGMFYKGIHYIGKGGGHASTITGRRFNKETGLCEYRIKNSWGENDDSVPPSFSYEKGNYWVPRTTLTNSVTKLYYLQSSN